MVRLTCFLSWLFFSSLLHAEQKSIIDARGKVRFTVIRSDLIRMEYDAHGRFRNFTTNFAFNRNTPVSRYTSWQNEGMTIIQTKDLRLEHTSDGQSFNKTNLKVTGINEHFSWFPGKKGTNLGGPISSLDGVSGPVPLPDGLLSRDGYHVIDDSRSYSLSEWIETEQPNSSYQDLYFFGYGADYKKALKALTAISGKAALPRRYVMGSWYSRYWPYSSEDYLSLVDDFDHHQLPLDIMVFDMDWHHSFGDKKWTGYTWNQNLIPNPQDLVQKLDQRGIKVCLNDHPADGVHHKEENYSSFMNEMGQPADGRVLAFDAGNEEYMDAFWQHTHKPAEQLGIAFWWLDWQQQPNLSQYPRMSHLSWLNRFYFDKSRANNRRGQSFSRWGGFGDHRHPIHFSGDASTSWESLAFQVEFHLRSSNSGLFFWSHDIGGHWGNRDEEAVARWVQFGATSPALRFHSTRDPILDRRPWSHAPLYFDSIAKSMRMRTKIFPYIYTSAYQAYDESLPLNRPMYIEFPQAEESYQFLDQFFLGDHLLVAPLLSPGVGENKVAVRKIFVPGEDWFFNHESGNMLSNGIYYTGGRIDQLPIFIRGGALIPMQDESKLRMTDGNLDQVTLVAFPGKNNKTYTSFLYEDDGQSESYQHGNYAKRIFHYHRKGKELTLEFAAQKGNYQPRSSTHYRIIFHKMPPLLSTDLADAHIGYDAAKGQAYMEFEKHSDKAIKINILFAKEPQIELNDRDIRLNLISSLNPLLEGVQNLKQLQDVSGQLDSKTASYAFKLLGFDLNYQKDVLSLKHPGKIKNLELTTDRSGLIESQKLQPCGGSCTYTLEPMQRHQEQGGIRFKRYLTFSLQLPGLEAPLEFKVLLSEELSYITKWNLLGKAYPFTWRTGLEDQVFPPERSSESLAKHLIRADPPSEPVNIRNHWDKDYSIAYLQTYLHLEEADQIELSVNSDDGVQVFVDNRSVLIKDVARPVNHSPDKVRVSLSAGSHRLLVKVANHRWDWKFKVGVDAAKQVLFKLKQ